MNNKVSSILARMTALALLASPLGCLEAQSQEVYSQIVGAIAIDVPAQSDVVVAFPFKRSASFRGRVVGAPGATTFSVAADSLTNAAFGPGYYVFVEDGVLKGHRFDIVSNTTSQVTVDAASLTGLAADDTISIREHWTLSEAFPQGVGFVEEVEAGLRDVELIVPDQVSVGGGIAAESVFYYYKGAANAAAWREVGKPLETDVGSTVLRPGAAFVVRNNSSEPLRSYFFGEVVTAPVAIPVVSATTVVDNFVSLERPLKLGLSELGLGGSVFTASTGTTAETRGDSLLVYETSGTKISNDDIKEYYLFNDAWYAAATNTVASAVEIKAGTGLAIRKKAGSDATAYWVNEWSLPQ